MKRILVPTDFSQCADNATQVAIEIAAQTKAEIDFLHFTSIPINWVNLEENQGKLYPDITLRINERKEDLEELVKQAAKAGVTARSFIGYNESYQNIINHVNEHETDLIIMGSHGASGFKELILGSNAQKIIRLSKIPVLVIKEKTEHMTAEKLVLVSDFSCNVFDGTEDTVVQSLNKLIALGNDMNLDLHLLYINTPEAFESSKEIEKRMNYFESMIPAKVHSKSIINSETMELGLNHFIESNSNMILGMMTHGSVGIPRLFQGSLVEEIANHIDNPLISVKMV